jgi:hypothetical protein
MLQIRALCAALKGSELGAKFGVAALPRHLRRRAGSHKPFHRHRFRPNAKLASKRRKLNPDNSAEDGSNDAAAVDATPKLSSLAARPFTNRRMRRQPAALQERFRQLAAWTEQSLTSGSAMDHQNEGSSQPRRLETHVWHAKRLAMEER